MDKIADKLAPHPLFARLDRDTQLGIAARCEIVRYAAGAILMRQGEDGSFAAVVLEGEIDIFVEIPPGPVHMATVGQNHIVGELGLLTGTPRTATAVARTDVVTIHIEHDTLLSLNRRVSAYRPHHYPGAWQPSAEHESGACVSHPRGNHAGTRRV